MEIGPLSEWVGALASFTAVAVALFLPYYTARQQTRRRLQRFHHIVSKSLQLAADNQLTSDFSDFKAFIKISLMLETSDTAVAILQVGHALVTIVGDQTTLSPVQIKDVQALQVELATLQP